ncbi:MAG: hypothetical protein CMJ81_20485 [Planctomycetaceae bacterium]|nr:hypothetical protein [Planctomycetaceae bacterium]
MARKFIELNEVASLLGMTPAEVSELRSQGGIHGYRDGSTWKFKVEEVQKAANDRGLSISEAALAGGMPLGGDNFSSSDVDADLNNLSDITLDDSNESLLVTDEDPKPGPEESASITVIGLKEDVISDAGSDLHVLHGPEDSGSDLQLVSASGPSDAAPADPDALTNGSDDLLLAADSDAGSVGDADEISKDAAAALDSGENSPSGDSFSIEEEAGLQLEESDVVIDEGGESDSASTGDSDLVLGSSSGSDIVLDSGDSGISLSSPSDTGLALTGLSLTEEPLELGGSSAESGLELPGDLLPLEEDVASGEGTPGDFLLTPVEEGAVDESDSGSQVIALGPDDSFGGDSDNLLNTEASGALQEAEPLATASQPGATPSVMPAATSEPPYSIWNVLALSMIAGFLMLTGMFMYDLVRHIWSWDELYSLNSGLMDWLLSTLGG